VLSSGEIQTGLNALQKQVNDISNTLNQLVAEIANLLPAIQNIIDQALYRSIVNQYLGLAQSANQNIATYCADATTAWQRINEINKALDKLQDSVNVILNAGPMGLDVAVQVSPLISTWLTEWDMNEAVWKANDATHIVVNARDHKFIKDAVIPSFTSFFDRCDQAVTIANSDLANQVCPGFPDDFSIIYSFDMNAKRFTRESTFPRAGLFKYDSFIITGALRISQAKGSSFVWLPAVTRQPNGTVVPNDALDNPTLGYTAWQTQSALATHLRSCKATLTSLADHTNQRKKVMAAFGSL
jgi:hypothetical protein